MANVVMLHCIFAVHFWLYAVVYWMLWCTIR